MTADELAGEVANVVGSLRTRIMGVGTAQYDLGDTQKFETMPLPDLLDWLVEEIDDGIVYLAMLRIRLRVLEDAIRYAAPHVEPAVAT